VLPPQNNTAPAYNDYDIRPLLKENEMTLIVAPDGSAPATLLQDTWFSIGQVKKGKSIEYKMHQPGNGVYIFLIEGKIEVDGETLSRRDGLGVYDTDNFKLDTLEDSHILLMEVPMVI